MEVEFADGDLARLETDPAFNAGQSQAVVKKYRQRIQMIRAARDERDFYALKSLHFEKMQGGRAHQHSVRLNGQFRLILEFVGKSEEKVVRVCGIEDYH